MNRKIFLLSLITVLSINNAQAAWYSPAVFMGKLARKYVVCTKKDAAFTAVIAAGLGYWTFSKLRDWRIERAKRALINRAKQYVKDLSDCTATITSPENATIWGKPWSMTIEARGRGGQGTLKVINGSVATVQVQAEQSL
jgi:hypothetical protein